ncbi:Alpha/Beta hydrolase protein [Xylariaceae sp. FL0016]|nr:Alpha/Beta hydrolase protein [Xylariaceae sp. FL0016]
MADQSLKGFEGLDSSTHNTLSFSHTPASHHQSGAPILLLLHGWPQDRYIWRYAVPPLAAAGHTLFVPDLPGYGRSPLPDPQHADRSTVGAALLAAVRATYGAEAEDLDLDVVLVAHDRGARVAQRLTTTPPPWSPLQPSTLPSRHRVRVLGSLLLDIVPYTAQWAAFANPRHATKYFHWAFLPAGPLSAAMIKAYGGANFCRVVLEKSAGASEEGRAKLFADGAADHYARMYEQEHVIVGGAADYAAGAGEDWDAEQRDLETGRKIGVPTCVLFSERNVGGMHGGPKGVREIWAKWVHEGVRLEVHGIGGDIGHYLPEEAPQEVNGHIVKFLESLGVKGADARQ